MSDLFGGTTSNKGKQVDVIPFGKYKGQPVEILQSDRQYSEWLQAQDWFREKYQNVYNVIINNFGEPDETPEHNAIQARFLDEEFCARLMSLTGECGGLNLSSFDTKFEVKGIDVIIRPIEWQKRWWDIFDKGDVNYKNTIEAACVELEFFKPETDLGSLLGVGDSVAGSFRTIPATKSGYFRYVRVSEWQKIAAVRADYTGALKDILYKIEIKPMLGDDYPAVLRNMIASACNVLVIGSYTGVGATLDQVRKMFSGSGISIYQVDEIELSEPVVLFRDKPLHIENEYRQPVVNDGYYRNRFQRGPHDGMEFMLRVYTSVDRLELRDEGGVYVKIVSGSGDVCLWEWEAP